MRRTGAVVLAATLLAGACGGDDGGGEVETGGPTTTVAEGGGGEGVDIGGIDFDLLADLPVPASGLDDIWERPPLAAWDGGAVILGPGGGLVRIPAEGEPTVEPTEGIDVGDDVLARGVDALASNGETLLAVGREQDFVADVYPDHRPVVWRSTDGLQWEQLDTEGLEDGANPVTVDGVVADGDAFIAFGEIEEEDEDDQTALTLWRSDDGEAWTRLDTPGLDQPPEPEVDEHLVALAVRGDTFVALREQTGLDDSDLTVVVGERDGEWAEVEDTGLEPLDLPNSDVLPPLATVGDELWIFANVPVDTENEFGERRVAVFTSTDGVEWTAEPLDGPELEDPFFVQALTATDAGAIGVTEAVDELTVWRFRP